VVNAFTRFNTEATKATKENPKSCDEYSSRRAAGDLQHGDKSFLRTVHTRPIAACAFSFLLFFSRSLAFFPCMSPPSIWRGTLFADRRDGFARNHALTEAGPGSNLKHLAWIILRRRCNYSLPRS